MLQLAMKVVNRWRRIYHLQRHGKQILQRLPDRERPLRRVDPVRRIRLRGID
jgi:hypothetical protein